MGPFFTALFLAVGAGAWVFVRFQNRTGYGNNTPAIVGTAVTSLLLFVTVYLTLRLFW